MSRTVRSWQKRAGWRKSSHAVKRKEHYGEKKDRFRFDPRVDYR